MMSLVQEERLGGNSLTFADKVRKGVAKKQGKLFEECEKVFFENIEKKGCSQKLAHYVWDVLLKVQRGYSFNRSHCLAYSIVGLQEMNLAYRFPTIFWDCACLIVNSGEGDTSTNYDKIAKAIGDIRKQGTNVSLVDINESKFEFKPNEENNEILFGMKGLNKCGDEVIDLIIANRPYLGLQDFLNKCKVTKTVVISLIKSGAFDKLEHWADKYGNSKRKAIMAYYLMQTSEPKKKLTLQNFNGMLQKGMIPDEFDFEKKVYSFNKYLKTVAIGEWYNLSGEGSLDFYKLCDPDLVNLEIIHGVPCVSKKIWDKIYKNIMDSIRDWLKNNQDDLLEKLNFMLFKAEWEKYATGTLSAWEMESLCFYCHEHELAYVNKNKYGITDFEDITPLEIEKYWKTKSKEVPIYKLYRIVGTVIGKNTIKGTVTLLTTKGTVSINFAKEYFSMFNKRISEINQETEKKEYKEDGWFSRGTMIMVTGYKINEASFKAKTYSNTAGHQLYRIVKVSDDGKDIELTHDRYGEE